VASTSDPKNDSLVPCVVESCPLFVSSSGPKRWGVFFVFFFFFNPLDHSSNVLWLSGQIRWWCPPSPIAWRPSFPAHDAACRVGLCESLFKHVGGGDSDVFSLGIIRRIPEGQQFVIRQGTCGFTPRGSVAGEAFSFNACPHGGTSDGLRGLVPSQSAITERSTPSSTKVHG